ncbi:MULTISPECIES: NADH-quinone oxidoreductase subunit M [unclassified Acinetobacter]|uniref:NADH-quinone oxidoreductase subunit M n=1 Tax=unclassified Acinetobacter TaxID=196816 RepID=UPI00293441D2|nr:MULTISPECIES: NADH-quinone oxidoreductase subunit M [unclassified Acinetobacter]WOE32834.1 NADH-quinone oxidoreductase subunit M [Acinetobacter sp. SAAs470]WOE38311.1 NADH-quinone oxidoreductase subunit M [Acinetobacter sp. SAAs474]
MEASNNIILPALILIPFIAGFVCWLVDKIDDHLPRYIALLGMVITFILTLVLWQSGTYSYELGGANPTWAAQFYLPWIQTLGINIHLAIDGLSLLMVGLTALLGILAVGCSWGEIQKNVGFFHLNLLWSLGGVIGVFLAIDLFLFFFFWEMMLVPIYFLIALWGHKGENNKSRVYAATKFFIYTQVAGLIMLIGILGLVIYNAMVVQGQITFGYDNLLLAAHHLEATNPAFAYAFMLCFFIGFAVKLPVFPLHGWLPDAHAQAPTAGSVDLAGILIKTAAYGLLRFVIPFFPIASAQFADIAIIFGLIGIFYGAWCAFQQTDMKRLLAYTSISHMGFVLLAIYAGNLLTFQGLMIMMLAHGLSSAALFIMCGQVYERFHTRDMRLLGGIRGQLPYFSFFLMFFVAALVGIPGLGNFIGEFLILMGSFAKFPTFTIIAAISLVFAGLYGLILIHKTLFGVPNEAQKQNYKHPLKDLSAREVVLLLICAFGLLWLGLYPQTFLDISNSSMAWLANSYIPVQEVVDVVQQTTVQLETVEIQ